MAKWKGNANVLGVSIGKELIDRLKKQAIRETTKLQKPVSVTEIVKAAVEDYLAYWETGIETALFFAKDGTPVGEPPKGEANAES